MISYVLFIEKIHNSFILILIILKTFRNLQLEHLLIFAAKIAHFHRGIYPKQVSNMLSHPVHFKYELLVTPADSNTKHLFGFVSKQCYSSLLSYSHQIVLKQVRY